MQKQTLSREPDSYVSTSARKYQMPPVRQTLRLPGTDAGALRRAAESFPQAAEAVLRKAEKLAQQPLPSVTDKAFVPPSGDKRDFVSLSIYFWPNPDTPDGLPYVQTDGRPNPELEDYDYAALNALTFGTDCLTIAWQLTGERPFAEAAADRLRRWFLDPHTGMRPNMNWAQFVPGEGMEGKPGPGGYPFRYIRDPQTGRGLHTSFGGTIEACNLLVIPELSQTLLASESWSEADHRRLADWFGAFTDWLYDSVPGNDARQCRNNHAAWFCAYAGAGANFSGREARARELFASFCPQRLLAQIEPDGSQPEELQRATSFGYTVFTLYAFCNAALLAESRGIDLWNHPAPGASRLRKGVDFLLPVCLEGAPWPYRQGKPIAAHEAAFVFAAAFRAWGDEKYRQAARAALRSGPPAGFSQDLNQLLYHL